MKELIEQLFWPIVIILSSISLLFLEVKNYKDKRSLKLRTKYTEENIVDMKIVNKMFSKGAYVQIGGSKIPGRLPATYIVQLEYEDNSYEINDKEIFDSYDIGQTIKLKLVKNLDENRNVINYDLLKIR